MPKQQAVVGLVEGESNINRKRTSPLRKRQRLMKKHTTPLSRVCPTNRSILGAARAESAGRDYALSEGCFGISASQPPACLRLGATATQNGFAPAGTSGNMVGSRSGAHR